ncbi:acetylxylan esterase [Halobacteria archaeon AArc-m2/3/4]|uniref:Acetylxylan esterase n=1 Tax=Natronoglomus mannanivorans TaxID=2979990 RepID=A0ABT2QJ37_9EURY|nr:acetylxylan esterase [Halobacteria archaeon AArc-m2/3/4]
MVLDTDAFPPASRLPSNPDLPDPLETLAGEPVSTPAEWRARRSELEALFRYYVYGYAPGPEPIAADVDRTESVLDGKATLLEATIRFVDLPDDAPTIELALFVPTDVNEVPVFLGLNREGNHAVVDDDAVTITDRGRRFGTDECGTQRKYWCVERILERGYGFATYHCADIDPDRDDFTDGIHPYYDTDDLPGPPGTEWGTLAAWAWGLQRCVDYLRTESVVRSDEIAVVGHSRRGKAALLAGATDERIGLVVPHQSGTGGCALSRDNDQESVARINGTFPHWFNDVFPAFGSRESRLPVDQHLLVALVAPRPLLDTEGSRDYWANPGRAYDALQAAAPVYDLLGAEGLVGTGRLSDGDELTAETADTLCQYRRETGHTLNRGYWDVILEFADLHFSRRD